MKKFEQFFKLLFFKIMVRLAPKQFNSSPLALQPDDKVLFIRLNRIGDALVTTALLKTVKERTGCHVHVLADEKNYFVFRNAPFVDRVYVYRKGLAAYRELLDSLASANHKVIVDAHDDVSFTVSAIVRKLKAPYKFALRKNNAKLFTHTVERPNPVTTHVVDRILALASLFGVQPGPGQKGVFFEPGESAMMKAADFIEKKFPDKRFLLGVNISAGSDSRYWGTENFRKFVTAVSKYNVDIVPLSTTRDLKFAFVIFPRRDQIFYTPYFEEFAAMTSKIDMLFSPDTSTIHLASVHKKPVFGLYVQYETDDMIWSPYGSDFDAVITREPNFIKLTVDETLEKFKPFLEKYIGK